MSCPGQQACPTSALARGRRYKKVREVQAQLRDWERGVHEKTEALREEAERTQAIVEHCRAEGDRMRAALQRARLRGEHLGG